MNEDGQSVSLPESDYSIRYVYENGIAEDPKRIFAYLNEWIEAVEMVVNEFASNVAINFRIKIRLNDIKFSSLQPGLIFDGFLQKDNELRPIPNDEMVRIKEQINTVLNGISDGLTESLDIKNVQELIANEVREARLALADQLSVSSIPVLPSAEDMIAPQRVVPELGDGSEKKNSKKPKEERLFSPVVLNRAMRKMAATTTKNVPRSEYVELRTPHDVSRISKENVNSGEMQSRYKEDRTIIPHLNIPLSATKAILKGKGAWSFEWMGRSRRMQIGDKEWKKSLEDGSVSIRAHETITADIDEVITVTSIDGIQVKKRTILIVKKIHG
jgi:hypothetical protein